MQLVLYPQIHHQGICTQSMSYNRRWLNNADNKAERIINVQQQGCEVSNAREADKFVVSKSRPGKLTRTLPCGILIPRDKNYQQVT